MTFSSKTDQTLSLADHSANPEERPPHILVLDDQFAIRSLFEEVLAAQNYQVTTAKDLNEARDILHRMQFDVVFIDIFLSDRDSGLDLLPMVRELQPNAPAIVISGMANMDHVMEALKAGAYDMLCKPFNIVDMLNIVQRAVDKKRMADRNEQLVQALRTERDLLEVRVRAATKDLETNIDTLRLLNEQVAAMFEISQTSSADGSSEKMIERVFELLHKMYEFSSGFCIIYDIRARQLNMCYTQGEGIDELSRNMTQIFKEDGMALVNLAESENRLPVGRLQNLIWRLYPAPDPPREQVILVPLHIHQTLMGVVGLNSCGHGAEYMTQDDERMLGLAISQFLAALEQRNFIARTGQLVSLGELISEIAHDLRHPMTALRGASRMLIEGWRQDEKRERCLDQIKINLSRMESLVSELVNFYNPKEMNMVAIDLHALLDKAMDMSNAHFESRGIQVVRQFVEGQPQILGLTRNLGEAFINLLMNACQAMDHGGVLTVITTLDLPEEHLDRLRHEGLQPANYMMISIGDTGHGIPEEHRDRIFRRFFTTKEEGTGLGLSAVQRMVRKNLGQIHFESTVGQGTTFYVYLPKA